MKKLAYQNQTAQSLARAIVVSMGSQDKEDFATQKNAWNRVIGHVIRCSDNPSIKSDDVVSEIENILNPSTT